MRNILVIEDEEGIREVLKLTLELEGYKVFTSVNGKEGLEILSKMPTPCLILLDLMMPVMNGWEFMDGLNKQTNLRSIPVVVVTAFTEKANTLQGSRGTIKKPIELDFLMETVKEYCG